MEVFIRQIRPYALLRERLEKRNGLTLSSYMSIRTCIFNWEISGYEDFLNAERIWDLVWYELLGILDAEVHLAIVSHTFLLKRHTYLFSIWHREHG